MPKTWKFLSEEILVQGNFFHIKSQKYELPDGRIMPRYYTVEFADWVHAVALTTSNELIFVKQHRPPGKKSFLEIPGGGFDKKQDNSMLEAAQRELREETGYVSSRWTLLGRHFPNPALQTNQMHTFLALDCERQGDPMLDPFEDLETELFPVSELSQLLLGGRIDHSLVMASLLLSFQHLGLKFP